MCQTSHYLISLGYQSAYQQFHQSWNSCPVHACLVIGGASVVTRQCLCGLPPSVDCMWSPSVGVLRLLPECPSHHKPSRHTNTENEHVHVSVALLSVSISSVYPLLSVSISSVYSQYILLSVSISSCIRQYMYIPYLSFSNSPIHCPYQLHCPKEECITISTITPQILSSTSLSSTVNTSIVYVVFTQM